MNQKPRTPSPSAPGGTAPSPPSASLNAWSPDYVEAQYRRWLEDPAALPDDWKRFFEGFDLGFRLSADESEGEEAAAGFGNGNPPAAPAFAASARPAPGLAGGPPLFPASAAPSMESRMDWGDSVHDPLVKQAGVYSLIRNHRRLGHFAAKIDPLGGGSGAHPLLKLERFGLSEADLDLEFDAANLEPPRRATLREILKTVRATYCGALGVEFMHIQNAQERVWLQKRLEPCEADPGFSHERHREILVKLRLSEGFEKYLHAKYVGQKRFSLEGGESLIVALDALARRAADQHKAQDVILGMAHRGRLNVLANLMGKSRQLIFSEFEGNFAPETVEGDGDVKYHKGYSSDLDTEAGNRVHLTLAANPSHLEAIGPLVSGRARAKQAMISRRSGVSGSAAAGRLCVPMDWEGDGEMCQPVYPTPGSRRQVLPVVVHGDAAFVGQGVVWETLNLSKLEGYTTGGTVHLIVNNQIGFTTSPKDSRGSRYCTDALKGVEAPIFHVNGDDPAAVAFAAELALDYRQEFGKDVVVDIVCFRRWGHNESDEPAFTQPLMYEKIRQHPGAGQIYADRLREAGQLSEEELAEIDREINERLDAERKEAQDATQTQMVRMLGEQTLGGEWKGLRAGRGSDRPVDTGVAKETLLDLAAKLARVPEGFSPHPKLRRLLEKRLETVREGAGMDWATAESLAFASLLAEGAPVRMTGQDSRRGTFSQRHATLIDHKTGDEFTPLAHLGKGEAVCEIYDSPLSEASVLGFEYGVSLADPHCLAIWEAQFGDFVNGAQVQIDQFLACAESKWQRLSGLVLLLPHGYEGQGPEHSSARLERFLQLCAEDNLQVAYPTTPAQYFHLLRRQIRRDFRKPLIVMTPKSLLRHPQATSATDELAAGRFQEILGDGAVSPENVRRVLICSGKVYYDLLEKRGEAETPDVAIIRAEQLYPLAGEALSRAAEPFSNAEEWAWVQEEPQNMGAWTFIAPRLRKIFGREFAFIGRTDAASPATGLLSEHKREQARIVREAVETKKLSGTEILV